MSPQTQWFQVLFMNSRSFRLNSNHWVRRSSFVLILPWEEGSQDLQLQRLCMLLLLDKLDR